MSPNTQQNEYGNWVPAEPLPGTFGLRWEQMIRHRREFGQNVIRAWVGGWRDVRMIDRTAQDSGARPLRLRMFGAPLSHRRHVWRFVRSEDRWPDRDERHYLILGRWPGF